MPWLNLYIIHNGQRYFSARLKSRSWQTNEPGPTMGVLFLVVLPEKNLLYYTPYLPIMATSTTANFFCPQGGRCGEVDCIIYVLTKRKLGNVYIELKGIAITCM